MVFFSSRRRHTRLTCDWSSDVCSSDLPPKCRCCPALRFPSAHALGHEYREQSSGGAGDCAFHGEQATLEVGGEHFQVLHRDPLAAHPLGHPGAFQHPAGRCARPDRACRPPAIRLAVRLRSTMKAMPLHDAGEASAFGLAHYVDPVARIEKRHIEFLPDRYFLGRLQRDLTQVAELRPSAEMTELGSIELARLLESNLAGLVAVAIGRF